MTARIVIYHLAESKLNQVEQFAVDAFDRITIGRDAAATLRFDAAEDSRIAPLHARISIIGDPPRFLLQDCGSRAGTLLNGVPIGGEVEVAPGDEIELGPGGPKFVFDVQPQADDLVVRRIVIPDVAPGDTAPLVAAGEIVPAPEAAGHHLVVLPPSQPRRSFSRFAAVAMLGGLVIIGMIGAATLWRSPPSSPVLAGRAAGALGPTRATPETMTTPADTVSDIRAAIARSRPPTSAETMPEGAPDLAGTVRKIAGASRFEVADRWIELYGVDDPTTAGEHNQAVFDYLKPFAGAIACYRRGGGRFVCFGGGRDLAAIAIDKGFVRLTAAAPGEYRRLLRQHGGAVAAGLADGDQR